jgi:hypothetical protein
MPLHPCLPCAPQVSTPALSATPQTLRAQLQKLQAQEEEAERLRAKLVGKVELLREEAAALRGLDAEKRQLEEQVGAGCNSVCRANCVFVWGGVRVSVVWGGAARG